MARKKSSKHFPIKIKTQAYIYWFLGFAVVLIGIVVFSLNNRTQLAECANSISCINDLSGKYDPNAKLGVFMGKEYKSPGPEIARANTQNVLGDSTFSNKHIYVDLSSQMLYAKEGDKIIYQFSISSGKWGRTPTGDFITWIKLQSTRMKGGSKALGTYYDLPNVPYTMFFYNKDVPKYLGYSIHGAYWHNNFGHPMSHGCINMKPDEAKVIYDWANPPTAGFTTKVDDAHPGTAITIYGKAPNT